MKTSKIALIFTLIALASLPAVGYTGPQSSDGARRITPVELRQLVKKDEALLVDVRSPEAYKAGHVKGARNIPAAEIGNRAGELPANKLIATYCS
jgi:3-mercaptopyruvate sulfurtransferase SseA